MIDLSTVTLSAGSHSPNGEYCLEELVSQLAGEAWSDHPRCVCPVIAAYGRAFNDWLPDDQRQRLIPYAMRQIGTRGSHAVQRRRGFLCADYAVRRFAPIALRAHGLLDAAARLEALQPLTNRGSVVAAIAVAHAADFASGYAAHAAHAAAYAPAAYATAATATAATAGYAIAASDTTASELIIVAALELFDALTAVTDEAAVPS